jgi:hypothetical protein
MNSEMSNPWEQMLLVGSKKINVRANIRPKKAAEPFSNGSLKATFKEPLLNATFNNGSRHKTVVKSCV